MSDPYVHPETSVLKHSLGITDPSKLDRVERFIVSQRITEGIPAGQFDHTRIDTARRIEASTVSHAVDYDLMARLIAEAVAKR